jgi:hypothetical protein
MVIKAVADAFERLASLFAGEGARATWANRLE